MTAPLDPYAPPATSEAAAPPASDLTFEDMAAFTGAAGAYYFTHHRKAHARGSFTSGFNIGAAIFGPLWLGYRKLFLEALVLYGVIVMLSLGIGVVGTLAGWEDVESIATPIVRLASFVGMGFVGNGIYLRRARRKIGEARQQSSDVATQHAWLMREGGTSGGAVALLLAVQVALILFSR